MTLDELRESLLELALERHHNGITDRFAELVASIRARRPDPEMVLDELAQWSSYDRSSDIGVFVLDAADRAHVVAAIEHIERDFAGELRREIDGAIQREIAHVPATGLRHPDLAPRVRQLLRDCERHKEWGESILSAADRLDLITLDDLLEALDQGKGRRSRALSIALRRSLDPVVVERVAAIIADGDEDHAASLFNPGWTTAVVDPTAISALRRRMQAQPITDSEFPSALSLAIQRFYPRAIVDVAAEALLELTLDPRHSPRVRTKGLTTFRRYHLQLVEEGREGELASHISQIEASALVTAEFASLEGPFYAVYVDLDPKLPRKHYGDGPDHRL